MADVLLLLCAIHMEVLNVSIIVNTDLLISQFHVLTFSKQYGLVAIR